MSHTLIRTKSFGSVEGYCTCGAWSIDSTGTDESSRRYVAAAFKAHAGGLK